jgi:LPS-assembly lipoprotein
MKLSARHLKFGAMTASLLALPGLVGGCGFTPLYAAKGVVPEMAAIQVKRPNGRAGYLLGQSVDDELGRDAAVVPKYRLQMTVNEVRVPQGINVSNEATRYEVDMTVAYTLNDIKTGAQITKGKVSVNATYNAATQPYASMAASLDGEKRAAEAAAGRIRLELATYFASPRPIPVVSPAGAIDNTFGNLITASPVESPRDRALGGSGGDNGPAPAEIPDPYATSSAGPASP